jgi:hypothetical protein
MYAVFAKRDVMNKYFTFVLAILLVSGFAATQAKADLVYNFNSISNGVSPTSGIPWLTATFHTVAPGTVELTLSPSLEVGSEFIGSFAVNSLYTGTLVATYSSASNPLFVANTTEYDDKLQGAGTGNTTYDVVLRWDANHFNGTTGSVTYSLTGDSITEGNFTSMYAHIQGIIPVTGGDTLSGLAQGTLAPVPIPSAVWLLGTGLIGLIGFRKRIQI